MWDGGRCANGPRFAFALRFRWLTWAYDAVVARALPEHRFKARLIGELSLKAGDRVLDLGCGTGTLTIMLKMAFPDATVVGLDGDAGILERARRKADDAAASVTFIHGLAHAQQFALPGYFDAIVSSLLFHHLTTAQKGAALHAARRALRPAGTLLIADWGEQRDVATKVAFLGVRLLDGFDRTEVNARGALPAMIGEAGFLDAREILRERTVLGTLSLYRATAP